MGDIVFQNDENNWVMSINDQGIKFNRDKWPDASPDEFAKAVIQILEKAYKLKFEKKEPPYDRMGE